MYTNKTRYKVFAWIFSVLLVITLIPELGYAQSKEASSGAEALIQPEDVTEEDVVEKTETTTTYDLGNENKMIVFHGGQVRYENE